MTDNRSKIAFLKAIGWLQRFYRENGLFILVFFLLNYFTMAWSLINEDKIEVMIGYGFTLFLGASCVAGLLCLLQKPLLVRIAKWALVIVCFVPFFIESFVMYNYKALIGTGVVNSLLESNLKEMNEFIKMYVGLPEFGLIIGIALLVYLCGRYHLFSHFHLTRRQHSRVVVVMLVVCIAYAIRMSVVYTQFFYNDVLPLQRVYKATEQAIDNSLAYHKLTSQMNTNVEITKNDSKIKNIVFILGESTNRNHMHLYGYNLPNTPNLDELAAKGEISVFRDVISPHSTTVAVLSELFTFCDHESDKPWYEYNNLIDVMNMAGYKTYWLSNQESSGIWGNLAQIYAAHSTMHQFTRIRDSHEDTGILDEELFPIVDKAIAERSDDRNFYVVHLMGGHGLYYNRFPYIFSKFSKDDIALSVDDAKKEVIAQYDNALYYNDYIVSGIIDKFRDSEALVIYVPDHGEAVYDEGGFAGHIEENPSRHMIEIPVIIWASEQFKAKYPEKWAAIQAAVQRPYMTDDMIHTVMDIADIETPEYDPAKSIVSPDFDASRPRIFNDMDYETQIRTGNVPDDDE